MTPSGWGKVVNKDVLQGQFSQGKVVNAKVQFARYNGPLWLNKAVFKGTLEYSIIGNNEGVEYKLLDGKFETSDYNDYLITPDNPLVIKRIPSDKGCELIAEPLRRELSNNGTDGLRDLEIYNMFGEIQKVLKIEERSLNSEWTIDDPKYRYIPVYEDGKKVEVPDYNQVVVNYTNGDILIINNGEEKFHKTFSDGTVLYDCVKQKGKITYADGSTFEGRFFYTDNDSQQNYNISGFDLCVLIMNANSLESLGLKKIEGVETKNGNTMKYVNGYSEVEIAEMEKAAEEERRKAEEAEKARKLEELTANENKNNSIKAICAKSYAAPNKKVQIHGIVLEGKDLPLGGKTIPAVMKVYDLGGSKKTVALYMYIDLKDGTEPIPCCFAVSGSNIKLLEQYENGGYVYGPSGFPFAFTKVTVKGKTMWFASIQGSKKMTSDIYEGMSEKELEKALKSSGNVVKLEESNGANRVYSLHGVNMNQRYHGIGREDYHYEVGTQENGRFYFKNGKLAKWYCNPSY